MKRYLYMNNEQCTCPVRREIRDSLIYDINEKPRQSHQIIPGYRHVNTRETFLHTAHEGDDIFTQPNQHIFDNVCFSTMIWTEEYVSNDISYGYYTIYNSYFQIPQGIDLPQIPVINNEHYGDGNTEPYFCQDEELYYRYRVSQLESRLNELERTRTILSREKINDIHGGMVVIRNKPIKVKCFDDDEIFRVE